MNTKLNIKARRSFFSPTFLTLLIGVVVLVLGGPSIQAQTTSTDAAAPVDSSLVVAAKGSFSDPNGSITVTGDVTVSARMVKDTTSTTAPAIVLLDFDFSQLKGTSGSTKTTVKTYITGDNHSSEMRPLQASDTIILTVPYYDTTKDDLTARTMLVNAALKFDTVSGKLVGATISVGNNVVTSSAVGTTTTTSTIQ